MCFAALPRTATSKVHSGAFRPPHHETFIPAGMKERDPAGTKQVIMVELLLSLEEIERRHILRVLDAKEGNKVAASQSLGIDRKTLYRKLVRYGVERES
jgi:DNA-binding NtrC family response regulator